MWSHFKKLQYLVRSWLCYSAVTLEIAKEFCLLTKRVFRLGFDINEKRIDELNEGFDEIRLSLEKQLY